MPGIQMAKASEQDINLAWNLIHTINCADSGTLFNPCDPDAEETEFNQESYDDLAKFYELVMEAISIPSALERVVGGLECIFSNSILDPDSRVLELHPQIVATQRRVKELEAQVEALKVGQREFGLEVARATESATYARSVGGPMVVHADIVDQVIVTLASQDQPAE